MSNVTKLEKARRKEGHRVAVYCRVSTASESQMESLDNQMRAFNARMALHPEWELVKIYADEGLSGTSMKRRVQFNQMIRDCEAGKIDYILTKSVSRFARNTVDTLTTVRELKRLGVHVYFEKENIDTADSLTEMVLTIMASFAQEESRSISENLKWSIRKRFEKGQEVKVPLYGFYHTAEKLFLINQEEAEVVRGIFIRYAHGETARTIMEDMITRGIKPPAGDRWKQPQLIRMLRNEKYAGDVILQKTYVENHLSHRQIRNRGEVPMFYVKGAHEAIVDRHIFEQAQTILSMRQVKHGNCTYPYGEILKCPHCGKTLTHGCLNQFVCGGERILNGGWGCYGDGGCGGYLLIQNLLDKALIAAYAEKFGEKKERVDYYWLDDSMEGIQLGEREVTILWRDGEKSIVEMEIQEERFLPTHYAAFYNEYLERVRTGKAKNKYRHRMGLLNPGEAGDGRKGGAQEDQQDIRAADKDEGRSPPPREHQESGGMGGRKRGECSEGELYGK